MSPNTIIGQYRVLSKIGEGGMGEVYRARDTRLNREVAIKLLTASFAQDADRLRRFEQEARATSALSHPNILTIYDIGTHEGAPYIVAELLDGEELREQLNAGPLPVRKAIDYALQIVRGLAAAHENGIVHRDLKPENLFVTKDGRVKILDFGLAKLKPQRNEPVSSEVATRRQITHPGTVIGTIGYMSPEQVRGQDADHRADIFSFGSILYEMLTGKRAFQAESMAETMAAIVKEEPPDLIEANGKVSPQLERLVRRCLDKRPEQRFQSASDIGFAIEAICASPGSRTDVAMANVSETGATRSQWAIAGRYERLIWVGAAVLLTITALTASLLFSHRPPGEARAVRFSISPPQKEAYLPVSDLRSAMAVSPDGRLLALVMATEGKTQLWVRALSDLAATPLAGSEGATNPFWSPDSRYIGFSAEGKLKKIEATGGPPQVLCNASHWGNSATWNRDGVILFASGTDGIFRVSAEGGEPVQISKPDPARNESHRLWPYFLPDGRHYFFLNGEALKEGGATHSIYLGSLDSAATTLLMRGGSRMAYAPPGYLLYVRDGTLLAHPFDAQALRFTADPIPVAEKLSYFQPTGMADYSISENDVLVYRDLGTLRRLTMVNRTGAEIQTIGSSGNYQFPRSSPDGQQFVVNLIDPRTGTTDVWIYELSRENPMRFTFEPGMENNPIWSPDGQKIVFAADRGGPPTLVLRARTDSGPGESLTQTHAWVQKPYDWSPDGKFIIYGDGETNTGDDLWLLPMSGERKPTVYLRTQFNEGNARFSPDGRWVAYVSDESGRPEVYVQSFQGVAGKTKVSNGGGDHPQWRRDGKELVYLSSDKKLMAVPVTTGTTFKAGNPAALFSSETEMSGFDVSTDGQRFLVIMNAAEPTHWPINVVIAWTVGLKSPRGNAD